MTDKMLTCSNTNHGPTINDLAARGIIRPVVMIVDGARYTANSVWAATEWLKLSGAYERKAAIRYELGNPAEVPA